MTQVNFNINLYEEVQQLKDTIAAHQAYIEKLEKMITGADRNSESGMDNDLDGFITVNEILRKYNICHKTFFNYKKHVPIKKAGKVGKFDRYSIQDVKVFIEKIMCLKNENPSLFPSPFLNIS